MIMKMKQIKVENILFDKLVFLGRDELNSIPRHHLLFSLIGNYPGDIFSNVRYNIKLTITKGKEHLYEV